MNVKKSLTYSNLTSSVALVLALSGVGGAAYAAGLAVNSVGSPQIKDGQVKTADLGKDAVTSNKVKTGGLTLSDLNAPARKALTADAYFDDLAFHNISSGDPDHTIFETTVPAGNYLVSASADVTNTGGDTNDFTCSITQPIGSELSRTVSTSEVRVATGGDLGTISLDGVAVDTDEPIVLTLTCEGQQSPYSGKVEHPSIVAVELGTAIEK